MIFKVTLSKASFFALTILSILSCSKDEEKQVENCCDFPVEGTCDNPENYVFVEKDNLINVEFEDAAFPSDWELVKTDNNTSGKGYMVWNGAQSLGTPGNGLTQFKIKINNPGTYRFVWRSAVKTGTSGSDHNDSWLRFNDANDFYGEKTSGSIVYPGGSGKTPNPNGTSIDGWFKIYRSGNDLDFKWQASTSDNDSHNIFVVFAAAGEYTMEVSARSTGHAIDKFVLYKESEYTLEQATTSTVLSEIVCK